MNKLSPVDQLYHLEPHTGLLNDPVGLVWHDNHYHVFFQWNSRFKDHSQKEWGHFVSSDLLEWVQHPSPLIPSEWYDRNGVYSGSCCVVNQKLLAFYTGNRKENGIRTVHQCLAVSEDSLHFNKEGPVLPVLPGYTTHFRDPRVFENNGMLYMLIGAQNEQMEGCILLLESIDGRSWTFLREIGKSRSFEMIECPELVQFEQGCVLIYGLQKRDRHTDACLDSFSVYQVLDSDFREVSGLDLDENWIRLEDGFDGYAHQALYDPSQGRYLLMAWMNRLSDKQEQLLAGQADHIHCLSLPRQLDLQNGKLIQKPAPELDQLFEKSPVHPGKEWESEACAWKLDILPDQRSGDFSLLVHKGQCRIEWNQAQKTLRLIRRFAHGEPEEICTIPLKSLRHLSLYMDRSSLEVFVNHGEHVLSARLLPSAEKSRVQMQCADENSQPKLLFYPYKERFRIHRRLSNQIEGPNLTFHSSGPAVLRSSPSDSAALSR